MKVYRLVDLMESYPGLPPQLQFLLGVLRDFPGIFCCLCFILIVLYYSGPLQVEHLQVHQALIKSFVSQRRLQHALHSWPLLWSLLDLFVDHRGDVKLTFNSHT